MIDFLLHYVEVICKNAMYKTRISKYLYYTTIGGNISLARGERLAEMNALTLRLTDN